jgi:hypothetical protein
VEIRTAIAISKKAGNRSKATRPRSPGPSGRSQRLTLCTTSQAQNVAKATPGTVGKMVMAMIQSGPSAGPDHTRRNQRAKR